MLRRRHASNVLHKMRVVNPKLTDGVDISRGRLDFPRAFYPAIQRVAVSRLTRIHLDQPVVSAASHAADAVSICVFYP